MSLPDTRNRTYAATNRFARADVLYANDILVATYSRRRRPLRTHRISPYDSVPNRLLWPTGPADLDWTLKLPIGTRIRTVGANVFRNSSALTLALRRSPDSAPTMADVSSTTGGTISAWADLTLTFAYPYHTIESGYLYAIRLTRGSSSDNLSALEVTLDIP